MRESLLNNLNSRITCDISDELKEYAKNSQLISNGRIINLILSDITNYRILTKPIDELIIDKLTTSVFSIRNLVSRIGVNSDAIRQIIDRLMFSDFLPSQGLILKYADIVRGTELFYAITEIPPENIVFDPINAIDVLDLTRSDVKNNHNFNAESFAFLISSSFGIQPSIVYELLDKYDYIPIKSIFGDLVLPINQKTIFQSSYINEHNPDVLKILRNRTRKPNYTKIDSVRVPKPINLESLAFYYNRLRKLKYFESLYT